MDPDNFAEKFSEAVFNYIWFTEKLVSDKALSKAFDKFGNVANSNAEFLEILKFLAQTTKAVVVWSALTFRSFDKTVEDYYEKHAITRLSVSRFLATYCLDNHSESSDIFEVILNTFAFVYRVMVFCLKKVGDPDFVQLAPICWTKIFEEDLKDDFHESGGWRGFEIYVSEKLYALKYGDAAHRSITAFLDYINPLFPSMYPEWYDPEPSSSDSDEDWDKIEEFFRFKTQTKGEAADVSSTTVYSNIPCVSEAVEVCVEKVHKPETNGVAAEFSSGTVSSNISCVSEKDQTNEEKVHKPETNDVAAEFSSGTASSNIPCVSEKDQTNEEKVHKPETNGVAAEFSSGTVSSNIPCASEKDQAFVEKVHKLQTRRESLDKIDKLQAANGEANEFSSNISDFKQKDEACLEEVEKLVTNNEEIEYSFKTFFSSALAFSDEVKAYVEQVENSQTNREDSEFSFGSVDEIISKIPDFNEDNKAVEFQFDDANTDEVKCSIKSNSNFLGKSTLIPVITANALEKSRQTCLLVQISEIDHCSTERNATNEDPVTTAETSTAIQENSKVETIQENSDKELNCDIKDNSLKPFPNIGKYVLCPRSKNTGQESMQDKDQTSSQDPIRRQATENPIAVNPSWLFDKLYVNGKIFDKYTIFSVNDLETERKE